MTRAESTDADQAPAVETVTLTIDDVTVRVPKGTLVIRAAELIGVFVAFSRQHGQLDGQIAAFFTIVVAACEVVVGLAIIMTIFRTRRSASVDDASLLKY